MTKHCDIPPRQNFFRHLEFAPPIKYYAPLSHGWVVVAAREELKNADDLHVMHVYLGEDLKSFHRKNGAKVNLKVLCDPLRYRSLARIEKKKLVEALKLRRSDYALNSIPDHESY